MPKLKTIVGLIVIGSIPLGYFGMAIMNFIQTSSPYYCSPWFVAPAATTPIWSKCVTLPFGNSIWILGAIMFIFAIVTISSTLIGLFIYERILHKSLPQAGKEPLPKDFDPDKELRKGADTGKKVL